MKKRPASVRTWDDVAVALGITTRQLGYDRKQPGAPKAKDIDKWRKWRGRKRPSTLPADSDPGNDTLGERRLREEIRGMQLANDAREKRHQIEAKRIAEEVCSRSVASVRAAIVSALPLKIIEHFKPKNPEQEEAAVRGLAEEILRGVR